MNATSEQRLSAVHPTLAAKIHQLAASLAAEGTTIIVVQGLRTVDEQDTLYEQGRTTPGNIVTNARGGYSWHNFGLAVDCAPLNADASVDWNAAHPQWKRMESAGQALGLTSGATFVRLVDAPHFQLTGQWPIGAPADEVRILYAGGGLQAVWHALQLTEAGL